MLLLIIVAFIFIQFEIKFDFTREKKLLLWYTHKKERKFWVLW